MTELQDTPSQTLSESMKFMSYFSVSPDEVYLALFTMTIDGPEVEAAEFRKFLQFSAGGMKTMLSQQAIASMVALNPGSNYQQGMYLLPFGLIEGYRMIVMTINLNPNAPPREFKYHQIAMIVPGHLLVQLPSLVVMENEFVPFGKKFLVELLAKDKISQQDIYMLKLKLLTYFNKYIDME